MNNLGLLPIEVISLIVSYIYQPQEDYFCHREVTGALSKCSLINRRFYTTTLPFLWRSLIFNNEASFTKINITLLTSQQSLGQHVRQLVLDEFPITDLQFLQLMKLVPNLQSVDLHCIKSVTDISFQHLPRHCPSLTHVYAIETSITIKSIVALGQHCRRLRELFCHFVTQEKLSALFSALVDCPLEELKLDGPATASNVDPTALDLDDIDDDGDDVAYDSLAILSKYSSLINLHISNLPWSGGFGNGMLQSTITWPHLKKLSLDGCGGVTTSQLNAFLKYHQNLTDLHLLGLPLATDIFTSVAVHLPTVEDLTVFPRFTITANMLRRFLQQCRSLHHVSFSGDTGFIGFSDADFPGVCESEADVDRLRNGVIIGDLPEKIRAQSGHF